MSDTIKFVFLVTGHERDFTVLATNRVRSLVTEWNKTRLDDPPPFTLPARVRFVHLNFELKTVLVYEHPFVEKGTTLPFAKKLKGWQPLATFTSDTGTDADNPTTFVDPETVDTNAADFPKSLSITNLYHSVRGAPNNSVLAVEIFSHAWVQGPVLVNTDEDQAFAGQTPPMRTPKDMDGRTSTDFKANMGEDPAVVSSALKIKKGGKDALVQFIKAFDLHGHFRVYGCDVQDIIIFKKPDGTTERNVRASTVFQVLHQAFVLPLRKGDAIAKKLRKKEPPGVDLTLDMGQEFQNEATGGTVHHWPAHTADELRPIHYSIDRTFFDDLTKSKITKSWDDILAFVARQTETSYVFKAAEALSLHGVTCHGAVPGTGGEFEKQKTKTEEGIDNPLMRVCRKEGFGCDKGELYTPWLAFFEDFMSVKLDDHNYGIFDSDTIDALDALTGP
jgi:hypothetical protein